MSAIGDKRAWIMGVEIWRLKSVMILLLLRASAGARPIAEILAGAVVSRVRGVLIRLVQSDSGVACVNEMEAGRADPNFFFDVDLLRSRICLIMPAQGQQSAIVFQVLLT